MKNQFGNSRMDTILKMLLIAFISLLAFSSGVYFGKQMSDNDYQLKALESDFSSQSKVAEHGEQTPEEAINDEEVAALSEKYVNAEKDEVRGVASTHGEEHGDEHAAPAAAGHGDEAGHKPAAAHGKEHDDHAAPTKAAAHDDHAPAKASAKHDDHLAPKKAAAHDDHHAAAPASNKRPDLSAAHQAAARVASNHSPVETPKAKPESRVPNSLPKTVGASSDVEFTVQVASYPTAAAAKEHADVLVKKGFPAFPVEATVNGRTWYRVSVGSFKTMKEATSYRGTLLKQAELQSAIVQRITR